MPNDPLLPGALEGQAALDAAAATTSGGPTNLNPTSNFSQNSQSYFNDLINQVNTLKQNLQNVLTSSEYDSAAKPTVDSILGLPSETNGLNPGSNAGKKIIFKGGNQSDFLNLGSGAGGGGNNIIDGANQSDTVYGKTRDVLVGANQSDSMLTQLGGSYIDGGNGNDNVVIGGQGSIAITGNGDDTVNSSRGERNLIDTGNGNDIAYLGKNDIALMGNGNDVVHMSGGGNIVQGGNGDDTFHIATGKVPDASSAILDFKPNDDKLSIKSVPGINSFADISLVQSGADTLVKFAGNELVVLRNVLVANLDANDFLIVPGGNNGDTTAPQISATLQSDTGNSTNDGITTIPAVTGTIVDQSAITSFRAGLDSTPLANFVSVLDVLNNNGTFLLDTARMHSIAGGTLSEGIHSLHLVATDSANNTSNIFSLTFQFVIDNSAPDVSVQLLNDTGIAGDNKTTDATIAGIVSEANQISSLKASLNNANLASFVDITGLVGAGGVFTLNSTTLQSLNGGLPVAEGQNILRLQSTDEFGNVSSIVSFSFVYVVDNAAPSLSVGLINDNGIGNADLRTTDPRISGLVQDSNVITSLKASVNDSNPANMIDITSLVESNGAFVLDLATLEQLNGGPLAPGQVTVRLTASDEFGNASSVLEFGFEYVIDNDAPEIQVALTADSGNSGSDAITNDPRISGSVTDANAVTQLLASLNDVSAAALVDVTALIDLSGNFHFNNATLETLNGGPLSDGTQTLRIKAQDEFGNISDLTVFTFELDSIAPSISVAFQSDNGANTGDQITSDPTIAGNVSDTNAVASLKASLNNENPAAMLSILHLVDSSGNFVLDAAALQVLNGNAALQDGVNTLRIVGADLAGNESAVTTLTFVLDSVGPEVNVALANDTGIANDGITSDPTITGTVSDQNAFGALYASVNSTNPLSLVDVSSQVNLNDGSFTLSRSLLEQIYGSTLPNGSIDIRLRAEDEFGNSSLTTFSFSYAPDLIPPTLTVDLQNDTGRSNSDNVSVDPTIAGSVADNEEFVQLLAGVDSMSVSSYVDVTAHVDQNGNYVLDQATLESINGGILTRGIHTVHLIAKDAAGNETPVDFTFNFNRPFTVFPSGRVRLELKDYFPGTDNTTLFTVDTDGAMPTGQMLLNGRLEFIPTIDEYGLYEFVVSAREGNVVASQEFAINVIHDPVTTTRITGRIVDLDRQPIHGVDIEFNGDHTTSDANGRFTLTVTGPITDDVITFNELTVYGENGEIEHIYAYLAQKIKVLLGHDLWEGINNIIHRVEYLPELDVANGHIIDPNVDQAITTAEIPGVKLEFGAGTLLDTDGTLYDELLTITEMPVNQMPISRPPNLFPDLVIAIQPERLTFTTPAQLTMPDRTNNPVGYQFDLYAIDPILGDFQKVGEGVKQADGLIHTTSGGITTTDWSFFVPRPEQSGKGVDPGECIRNDQPTCSCNNCPGTNSPPNGNLHGQPAKSIVNSLTGELLESYSLTGYQSLGENRTLTLTYGSLRANPEQLFHVPFENAVFGVLGDNRTRFVAELWIQEGNFKHELPGFVNANGSDTGMHFWRINTSASDAVAKIDMREYGTGYYEIGVRNGFMITTPDGTVNGSATEFSAKIVNVNMVDSIFGAGWGLNGLQQIVENSDGSIIIVDGNGTQQLMRAPATVGGEYVGSGHDFSTMVRRPDGTFFRTLTDGTEMAFNEFNMLATITDTNNNVTTFNYDANGRLIGLTDEAGLLTEFNYAGERISSIVDPFGRTTELIHDGAGNLVGIKDPDGQTMQYGYDERRLLTETTDKREMQTQIFYGDHGRAERQLLQDGSELEFDAIQTQGYLDYEQTLDPVFSPVINFILSGNIPVEGEDNFRVINYTDANGNVISSAIDHEGRYVASRDSISSNLNVISSRVYTNGLVTRTYDGRGNFTDYTYDDRGNVLTVSDSLSASAGTYIDYLDVSSYGNSVSGVSNTTQPGASLVTLPFDFEFYGQAYNQIGVNNNGLLSFGGVNTNFDNVDLSQPGAAVALADLPSLLPFWDGFETSNNSTYTSRVSTATIGDMGTRKFIIQWQQVISPDTVFEQVLYDYEVELHEGSNAIHFNYKKTNGDGTHARGRDATVGIWNSAAEYQQFSFNQVSVFDGQSFVVTDSGFAAQTAPVGTGSKTFTYDPVFNQVTSITDELGNRTLFDIDPANGNVLKMTRVVGAVGGSDDVVTEYSYNSHGQLTQVIDAEGRTTEYTYNNLGRVTFVTEAKNTVDERTTGYEYDLYGNVSAIIDPKGNRTEYEYDAMNRLTVLRRSDPDGLGPLESPETFFVYDDEGNLTNFTDAMGRPTYFDYDEVGRMIEMTDPLNNHRSYEYDNNGNITKITDELGRETQQFYDARNRLIKVIQPNGQEVQYVYDTNDNLTSVLRPGLYQEFYNYDSRNRLINTTNIGGDGRTFHYTYDSADNLSKRSSNHIVEKPN